MRILAIDPGTTESAWVEYDTVSATPIQWRKEPNDNVLGMIGTLRLDVELLAVEMIASYGMAVGREVFETCVWIGRYVERFGQPNRRLVYRSEVKLHLCNSRRAKDANIRQALIDRYGGSRETAIGKKATPGPLYGMAGDCWAALGVAVTAAETPGASDVPNTQTHEGDSNR